MKKTIPKPKVIKLFHGHTFLNILAFSGCPGTYIIISAENGTNKPINRAGGVDTNGVLYIGGAKDLSKRFKCIVDSINSNRERHPFGKRYNSLPKSRERYPPDSLYVWLMPSETPFKSEKGLKDDYEQDYEDYPPYNRN